MNKESLRKGDFAVKDTWKEKSKLKKRPEIKNKMPFKNQRVFSTNHKDFILIPKTNSFLITKHPGGQKGLKTLM